jgi:S1-C subfamily serine protease
VGYQIPSDPSSAMSFNNIIKIKNKILDQRKKLNVSKVVINKLDTVELGIQCKTNMVESSPEGVLILHIRQESILNKFGVQFGDIIRRIDGLKIRNIHDLRMATFFSSENHFIEEIQIERDGQILDLKLI